MECQAHRIIDQRHNFTTDKTSKYRYCVYFISSYTIINHNKHSFTHRPCQADYAHPFSSSFITSHFPVLEFPYNAQLTTYSYKVPPFFLALKTPLTTSLKLRLVLFFPWRTFNPNTPFVSSSALELLICNLLLKLPTNPPTTSSSSSSSHLRCPSLTIMFSRFSPSTTKVCRLIRSLLRGTSISVLSQNACLCSPS